MLCYSTGSLPDAFSFSEICTLLSPTPFRGIELVVTPEMLNLAKDQKYWHGIRADIEAQNLCFRNVHLGAPHLLGPIAHQPGLASLQPEMQARKFKAVQDATQIAIFLGSPHITLTTGLLDSEKHLELHIASLKKILKTLIQSKPKNLIYLIEQEPEHVIRSTSQLLDLGREFAGEIFANFDVGHSHVMGEDIAASILELKPFLRNIHLEDIRGRVHAHKLFGEGDIDFDAVFSALKQINYSGDYTPDLYPFKNAYHEAIRASVDFLKKYEL